MTVRDLAAQLFGVPSGLHTHPATHPLWMTFQDANCLVCGNGQGGAL